MKTAAILISGHTRDFERTLPGLIALKEAFDADVFISSYTDRGTGVRFWLGQKHIIGVLTQDDYKLISENLNPISAHYENQIRVPKIVSKHNFKNKLVNTEGVYGMLYKFWHTNELKKKYEIENNFKYEVVIRTRFDNEYLTVNINDFRPGRLYTGRADRKEFLSDSCFICDSESMNKLAELKNEFCIDTVPSNYHNAEHMFTHFAAKKGIVPITDGSVKVKLRDKLFL